jgi:hypothetical protein
MMCVYVTYTSGNVCDNHIQDRFSSIKAEADNAGWRTHWEEFEFCLRSEEDALKMTTTTGRWKKRVNAWRETRLWTNILYKTFGGNDKGRLPSCLSRKLTLNNAAGRTVRCNNILLYCTVLTFMSLSHRNIFVYFGTDDFRKNYMLI